MNLILLLCPTNVSLPCGPAVYEGGRTRRSAVSALTQTWPKFQPRMGRAGRVRPVASPCWGGRKQRVGPIGPEWKRADQMR
jgi:hypothetical protein